MSKKRNYKIEVNLLHLNGAEIVDGGVYIPFGDSVKCRVNEHLDGADVILECVAISKRDCEASSHYIRENLNGKDLQDFKKHPILGHLFVIREFDSNVRYNPNVKR